MSDDSPSRPAPGATTTQENMQDHLEKVSPTDSRDLPVLRLLYRFDYLSWAWTNDYESRRKPLTRRLPVPRRRSVA